MHVLLVEPNIKKTWGANNQYVGLLRIANWLKSTGNTIEYVVAPTMADRAPEEIFITSMFTYAYQEVWDAVWHYKQWYPNAKVRLGGIYATLCPEHAARAGAHEVMVGQHPEARAYAPDPSALPYKQEHAYLFTSYGCNRACTYCATHILFGQGIRQEEPDKVLADLRFLYRKGFKKIWFGDDNLLFNAAGHIDRICEEIIRSGMKIELSVPGGMAAKDFTLKTALLMREAGFVKLSFALESTSAEVRKMMGRASNATQEDLIRTCEILDKAGFVRGETDVYFIIGLPYQKEEDMLDTLTFLLSLGLWVHPQRFTPIPNTVDWKRLGLEGKDYADLYYKTYLAPGQSDETLESIYKIARHFNIGRRYTNQDWLTDKGKTFEAFRNNLLKLILPEPT